MHFFKNNFTENTFNFDFITLTDMEILRSETFLNYYLDLSLTLNNKLVDTTFSSQFLTKFASLNLNVLTGADKFSSNSFTLESARLDEEEKIVSIDRLIANNDVQDHSTLDFARTIPDCKLYYPEPFIASPSFLHEEI